MFSFLLRIRVNGKVLKPARGKRLRADGRQPFPYRNTEGWPVIDPESRIGLRNRRTTWRLLAVFLLPRRRGTLRSQWSFIVQPEEKPSLYDRLGGVYSIATVVDDFINRIMVDPKLNANPLVDKAPHRVPPAGFKYLVTEMVCWATGGPQRYTGKSMAESHKDLKITSEEWEGFLGDFQQTLDKFKVPAGEQAELKAIVNSTRSDIVVNSALGAGANS
jgi:hemoglobin